MTQPITMQSGEPPHDPTKQYLVWAIHLNELGHIIEGDQPRWCVVQWSTHFSADHWASIMPGIAASVCVLEWAELPRQDRYAERYARNAIERLR